MEPTNENRLNKVIDNLGNSDLFYGVVDNDTHAALGVIELMKRAIREYNQITMEEYVDALAKQELTKL
jgi:hypothetical protein